MDAAQIQQVRRFNRAVTRRVGALDQSYLSRGRPLAEARIIFEAGPQGVDVRVLRNRLGLDSGYLSRLLNSLKAQGLARVSARPSDRRARRVTLTRKGRDELQAYDRLSDELARSMLAPLEEAQCARLLAAMNEVEGLIRAASVEVRQASPSGPEGSWCLAEYYRELDERFEGGFDPAIGNSNGDAELTPPAGIFVIASLDAEPIGCGGLKFESAGMAEIKRVWTAPSARGIGVAGKMVRTLETLARERGSKIVHLDTNRALKEAQALYRSMGYREVARYNDNPYAHCWFKKDL